MGKPKEREGKDHKDEEDKSDDKKVTDDGEQSSKELISYTMKKWNLVIQTIVYVLLDLNFTI